MHVHQNQILHTLMLGTPRRYSELKPVQVEGNIFVYHLKKLMRLGLVQKVEDGYSLTSAGLAYVDRLSLRTHQPRIQPKIVVLIACQNAQREWLLYRRNRQPFHGMVGFPYGKIHLGETVGEAAEREIKDKTGLMASLEHRGDAYVTVFQKGEVLSQMLHHIFVGKVSSGILLKETEYGQCFWQEVLRKNVEYFPGFWEILQIIQSGEERFFREFSFEA